MSFSFLPTIVVPSVMVLRPKILVQQGIRLLMLDFDNTIVPYTTNDPTDEMENWLTMMVNSDIGICVVSNSKRDRVVKFCNARNIPCITHSKKPFPKGIRQCREKFGFDMKQAALAGDQIYTDILGGNCAGAQSILVKPIHLHNIWLKLRHVAENPFIAMGKRNRI